MSVVARKLNTFHSKTSALTSRTPCYLANIPVGFRFMYLSLLLQNSFQCLNVFPYIFYLYSCSTNPLMHRQAFIPLFYGCFVYLHYLTLIRCNHYFVLLQLKHPQFITCCCYKQSGMCSSPRKVFHQLFVVQIKLSTH